MDKKALQKLSSRLTDLASELDDLAHDEEQPTLYAGMIGDYEDGVGERVAVWQVDMSDRAGALQVCGYDSVETLAEWLGAKIEKGIAE